MKKKIEKLLESGHQKKTAQFKSLHNQLVQAESRVATATEAKATAKQAYRDALNADDQEALMEKRVAFRQSKLMRKFEKEALLLARFKLMRWAEQQPAPAARSKNAEKPGVKKKKTAGEKAAA